jgi:cyclophilin family peptidyl-prolyl cis-trans isomerase
MMRAFICLLAILVVACANAVNPAPRVAMDTNLGRIVLELDAVNAPISTENFLAYVRAEHYDGTIFHRVIDGFVAQGGGYTVDYKEKPAGEPILNEATNGVSNTRGTLAMARVMAPHSAKAQFYINLDDNDMLDHAGQHSGRAWGYAVFGKVVEGMAVVDRMAAMPTGPGGPFPGDVPTEPVVVLKAQVLQDSGAEQPL